MNDMFMVGSVVGIGVALASLFMLYSVYGGFRANLGEASIGSVYNFVYQQPLTGEPERYLAKVLDVYQLSEDSIRRLNRRSNYRRNDPEFKRTKNLVTCQTPDGKIRNFYAERVVNCRRPLLAKALFGTRFAAALL